MNTQIFYDYAFGAPHRITLSQPAGSWKTLCDISEKGISMKWSYECLKDVEVNIWRAPTINWGVHLSPYINDKAVELSSWKRLDDYLPGFCARTEADGVKFKIEAIAGENGDVLRVEWTNETDSEVKVALLTEHDRGGWVISNPAWIDGKNPNALVCMENQRPNRILIVGFGADAYPIAVGGQEDQARETPMAVSPAIKTKVPGKSMTMECHVPAHGTKVCYLFRAYNMDQKEMPTLLATDWQAKFEAAKQEWNDLLRQATRYSLPDKGVEKALYACLSDVFIMSELDSAGNWVISPGSEVYRSANSGDGMVATDVLAKYNYLDKARHAQRVCLESQGEDGNWNDPDGWGHHGIIGPYFKMQSIMNYYRLTGDKEYLKELYPRMKSSLLWEEKQRASTRNDADPLVRGLMPRGMGDCGLWNGGDYFGVFYPLNICTIYGDRLICEAAEIVGDPDLESLRAMTERAREDLRTSLHQGYIVEKGFPIIPNVPRKPGGSTFAMVTSTYPCGVLDADDPLALGSLNYVESNISEGGQPVGNGWMPEGCWVAISLYNLAKTKIGYGDADAAAGYFLSALNYASPLISWPEERGKEPGTPEVSGDRQHVWTPSMICHYVRDAVVCEEDDVLHLLQSIPRTWLGVGEELSVENVPTQQGKLNLKVSRPSVDQLAVDIAAQEPERLGEMNLHLRVPEKELTVASVEAQGAKVEANGASAAVRMSEATCHLVFHLA